MHQEQKGQTLIIATIILVSVVSLTVVLLSQIVFGRNTVQKQTNDAEAREIAEAGIEYTIDQLNQSPTYNGGTNITFGNGVFDISVTRPGTETIVTSTGYYPNRTSPLATQAIEVTLTLNSDDIAFNYGVQVGQGGLLMEENATILGNVYSNGNIIGANNARITGDAYVAGGTALAEDQSVTVQTTTFTFGTDAQADIAQSFEPNITDVITKVQLYIRKNGNPSDALVKIFTDNGSKTNPSTTQLASGTLSAGAVGTSFSWVEISLTENPLLVDGNTYWIVVDASTHATRNWTIGSHDNSGYGNGIGKHGSAATNTWTNSSRDFNFKTFMGGASTYMDNVRVGESGHTCTNAHWDTHHGDAWANTIRNTTVECDAHYKTLTNTTVGRTSVVEATDPPLGQMPISEGLVNDWKSDALAGGTTTGDVTISANGTIGPRVITGNLLVTGGVELMLTGTLYVQGGIVFEENSEIYIDPSYGASSGIIVADGKITVQNNSIMCGSYYVPATNTCPLENPSTPGEFSYVLLISTDASQDPLNPSILLQNDSSAVIVYTLHGTLRIQNNAEVNEAVAYKLSLSQNSEIEYHSGLANANFVSGPGASLSIKPGSWRILQ